MNDMSTTSERSSAATKVITRMRVPGRALRHLTSMRENRQRDVKARRAARTAERLGEQR